MLKAERKYLDSLAEGVVCINKEGAFHYINTSAANFFWGVEKSHEYHGELAEIANKIKSEEDIIHHETEHKILQDGASIVCTACMIDGCVMLIFNENFEQKNIVATVKYALRHALISNNIHALNAANESNKKLMKL